MSTFKTSREIPAPVENVFSAFSDPDRLRKWWGPAGFSNTFNLFEFKKGGRWSFVMHGPDGKNYPNESIFTEILAPGKVVIQHISDPKFTLTVGLTSIPQGTAVSWMQDFENTAVAEAVKTVVIPANEQNLDRLTAEVLAGTD